MTAQTAEAFLIGQMTGVLPPGVPLSFAVISATWKANVAHRRVATAHVTMFDGLPATIEVRHVKAIHSHCWTSMEGGACAYEDGEWSRINSPRERAA